ncbi:undecaprenyldiphospho-muramoylpentapeptide beta-N-acetylglucosaminyltransferase [Anseongella ginsenosidimutans]|uniref:undecaprenyldiphospho-muramoylpentapeptide beta-N-acetylglucosaminyltransferase n=1 Tax=Anseongella ginsenosidimutans TaxID=496056 RepID=UPI0032C3DF68
MFPALAIADALKELEPSLELLFVGARGRIEMDRVPKAGYRIIGLDIQGLQRRLTWSNLLFPVKLIKSILKSNKIIKEFRPGIAVGVGGYASGPLLLAASRKGIPTVVQEQNSYPGITNKNLAKKAQRVFVAYEGMERFFGAGKVRLTGNPVREGLLETGRKKAEGLQHFELEEGKKTIFLTGGSLGAGTLNRSVKAHLDLLRANQVQVIWQTGKFYYHDIKKEFSEKEYPGIRIMEFISRVDLAYAAADLIIARAGAGTISELCVVGKPAILVPSPNVAEDHQTKNALALAKQEAALLVRDETATKELIPAALQLLGNTEKQDMLARNIRRLAKPEAAREIAAEIIKIAQAS